jgi:S-adenosylmethionine hydrolase
MIARGIRLSVNGREITSLQRFFAEASEATGELFAIWGSAGYLEIAAFRASAAQLLNCQPGQMITVTSDK